MRRMHRMLLAVLFLFTAGATHADGLETVRDALEERLPNAEIASLKETPIPGLYELVTGGTLLYVDRSGRYASIGTLYDLETHEGLSRRLQEPECNPDPEAER